MGDGFFHPDDAKRKDVAVLFCVDTGASGLSARDSVAELSRLCDTLGVEVRDTLIQKREFSHPGSYFGKGKLQDLKELVAASGSNTIVCDDELTPRQQGNLEKALGKEVVVIDRTAIILDIFALHATTREGKLQVELATLQYELPRLRGMWTHLTKEKLGGGVGARFGAGESQLETDRRISRKRISELTALLLRVGDERSVQRSRRANSGVYRVSLAGYTNSGKSTLLNTLTGADALAYNKLFATLDSTTRELELPSGRKVTLTDTVGFISKLPHELIEAFHSTLEEVNEADLLIHVCDASSPQVIAQIETVERVLCKLGTQRGEILHVFNKIDIATNEIVDKLAAKYPDAQFVSAVTSEGLDKLRARIEEICVTTQPGIRVCIPFNRGDLVQLAHDSASINNESYTENGTILEVQASQPIINRLEPFKID